MVGAPIEDVRGGEPVTGKLTPEVLLAIWSSSWRRLKFSGTRLFHCKPKR